MKRSQILGIVVMSAFVALAATPIFLESTVEQQLTSDIPTTETSQYVQLIPGSVYDGDTFRVTDGTQERKIRLCGIDAPELAQDMGAQSRDHLRSLLAQSNGTLIMVGITTDRYDRTVAEVFIPLPDSEEEIHLNSQLVTDGMAFVYSQYICPNSTAMQIAEKQAVEEAVGVWGDDTSQRPWDYRRQANTGK